MDGPSLAELEVWYYRLMRSANCTTSLVSRYPHDKLICMSTEYKDEFGHTHTHTHTYIYIYI